jgi:hypothetical protein
MKYLRTQFFDFLFIFLVPFVAAIVPWRIACRWLKFWARREYGPYDEAAHAAAAVAPCYVPIADARAFRAEVRLVWLLDCCDMYLSVLHRRSAWPWHLDQAGAWPASSRFIATGFHHATGMWVFQSLARGGYSSQIVSARFDKNDYRGLPVRYWLAKLRASQMARQAGNPIAFRPGARAELARSLGRGVIIVGVIDMPPRLAPRGQHPVRMLGNDATLPEGLLDIAREANVPLVPYWVEMDLQRCARRVCVGAPLDPNDIDGTLQSLADILDREIRRTPSAWFFWREWPDWLTWAAAHARGDVPNLRAQGIQYEASASPREG